MCVTCGAHTLLGPGILLIIPATVHLYMDKPVGELLWTNLLVIIEHPCSDQWEPTQYNPNEPRRPITGLEKCPERREIENWTGPIFLNYKPHTELIIIAFISFNHSNKK